MKARILLFFAHPSLLTYLLVGQQRVGLQRTQMAVDERRGSVVFTEQAAVDVVEPVPRNQAVPAGGTRETLQVVDISLCPHD